MHDDEEHEELVGEQLEERRARLRTDAFGRALGESWVTDGDGIYRYMPEPGSLKAPAPPPAEDRSESDDLDDLADALAPARKNERQSDDEPLTRARAGADDEPSRERKRSLWKRR